MKTVKINFDLEIVDGFPPVGVETLNAESLGDGTYEILNTPFFIKGTAFGDFVAAELSDSGRLQFRQCVKPSTYRAISIILLDEKMRADLTDDFRDGNCIIEYGEFPGYEMLAIAIPETVDYSVIRKFLAKHESDNRLSYAELVA